MLRHIRLTHIHAHTHTFITRSLNVMCRWLEDKPFYTKYSHCDDDVPWFQTSFSLLLWRLTPFIIKKTKMALIQTYSKHYFWLWVYVCSCNPTSHAFAFSNSKSAVWFEIKLDVVVTDTWALTWTTTTLLSLNHECNEHTLKFGVGIIIICYDFCIYH